ncbi:hypothetical protein ANA_C13472 [Anabaena sp. 90]|uniref:ARC6/PARC6 family protein n=1 Tax=Anabaena sp. 90 TaxID=46234 RepID=UPI00029B61A8|nr:ARC6/PARC6 family protein [Anabaena sp. 90]AFW96135.1 hypothetical protein ANA_C13472 [Anabaena sp. 90]
MKKLILCFTFLAISGCDALRGSSLLVSPASAKCPEKPTVVLSEKDVEEISLNDQTLTKSGQASSTKAIGYKFAAQSGERISLSTNPDICTWVYSPDNQIISGGKLPKTGKYIIEVSAPKGTKNFDLQIRLLDIVLTKDVALEIVKRWYKAKPQIFAPPFDTTLIEQITTGKLYSSLTSPDSSVAWLKKYDSYYKYNKSEITNVMNFSNSGKEGYINIKVLEELYLHSPKGIDQESSGTFTINATYYFRNDNGVWKISDYQKSR